VNCAYELGVNSYLVKPIAFDALLDMMKTLNLYRLLLNQARARSRLTSPAPDRDREREPIRTGLNTAAWT
jgi:hypothetical protein